MAYIEGQDGVAYIQQVMQPNTGLGSRHVQIANMIAQQRHQEMVQYPAPQDVLAYQNMAQMQP